MHCHFWAPQCLSWGELKRPRQNEFKSSSLIIQHSRPCAARRAGLTWTVMRGTRPVYVDGWFTSKFPGGSEPRLAKLICSPRYFGSPQYWLDLCRPASFRTSSEALADTFRYASSPARSGWSPVPPTTSWGPLPQCMLNVTPNCQAVPKYAKKQVEWSNKAKKQSKFKSKRTSDMRETNLSDGRREERSRSGCCSLNNWATSNFPVCSRTIAAHWSGRSFTLNTKPAEWKVGSHTSAKQKPMGSKISIGERQWQVHTWSLSFSILTTWILEVAEATRVVYRQRLSLAFSKVLFEKDLYFLKRHQKTKPTIPQKDTSKVNPEVWTQETLYKC